MKISVVIQGSPQSQSCATALEYTKAIIASEHEVFRVFFHQDAVLASNSLDQAPSDEPRIGDLWSKLAAKHKLEMIVCSTSAIRRGILDKAEAERMGVKSNLMPNFVLGGLGLLMDAVFESERTITFGE